MSSVRKTEQEATQPSDEVDRRYYSHVSAGYPGHRHSKRSRRQSLKMFHPSEPDQERRSYRQDRPIHTPQRRSSTYTQEQRRAMYSGLPASHYGGDAGPSRHAEMMTRAAFVSSDDQAQEAPAPHLDRAALMDEGREPRQYNLIIRQSPKHGQMCTLGSKNRRTLDPLPIIQLDIRDKDGEQDAIGQSNPFLLMQVHLVAAHIDFRGRSHALGSATSSVSDSSGTSFDSGKNLLPAPHDSFFAVQRLLEGKLVASAHTVWDTPSGGGGGSELNDSDRAEQVRESTVDSSSSSSNSKSTFFFFSDLSIRMCGMYRLHFSLLRLGLSHAGSAASTVGQPSGTIVAQCTSPPFPVVHSRDFAGISESTPLAKSFASQGVHIPIRNETKWRARHRTMQGHASESPQQPTQPLPPALSSSSKE